MKSVKRILGLILVSMMLMTMILPASADSALDGVTRAALTMGVGGNDATFAGEKLNLNFPGVTFTSSDNAVINATTGAVTRPQQAKNVTLTATAGAETKDFAFRIPGLFDNVPVESAIYYDDFNDGVLDSRIETTEYSQATMEANGKLNLQSNGTAGDLGTVSHTTAKINFKTDKTAVDGKFKVSFELKRDKFVYGRTRIFFSGPNGYAHYIDWMGSSTSDYVNWNTQIRLTTYGASQDDVLNTAAYKYVGTLKVEALFDNNNNGALEELIINGDKFNLNYCGSLATNRPVSSISCAAYNTNSDILMSDFACTQAKEPSAKEVIYEDDFEDGVLDSRIVKTDYSQETMEADGKLNFKSTSTIGDLSNTNPNNQSTGVIHFKEDKTAVDGKFTTDFELTRGWAYGGVRIYFTCDDGYAFYIDWCGTIYGQWTTDLRVTSFAKDGSSVPDDVQQNFVSGISDRLHLVAEIDNANDSFALTINDKAYPLNNGGYMRGKKVSRISVSIYNTNVNPVMSYISCTKEVAKEAVTATTVDYNAFDKKVTVVSPVAKAATVIAAAYSGTEGNAALVSAAPASATLVEGGSVTFDTSALNVSGASFVKLYMWDSVTGLMPLTEAVYVSDVAAN